MRDAWAAQGGRPNALGITSRSRVLYIRQAFLQARPMRSGGLAGIADPLIQICHEPDTKKRTQPRQGTGLLRLPVKYLYVWLGSPRYARSNCQTLPIDRYTNLLGISHLSVYLVCNSHRAFIQPLSRCRDAIYYRSHICIVVSVELNILGPASAL